MSDELPVRRKPCPECPWRRDVPVGKFPVERYRKLAGTSRDMALTLFGCHMGSADKTCAGFLLSTGAVHNFALRLAARSERFRFGVAESSVPLYASYRELAIANGVDPDDPCLKDTR